VQHICSAIGREVTLHKEQSLVTLFRHPGCSGALKYLSEWEFINSTK